MQAEELTTAPMGNPDTDPQADTEYSQGGTDPQPTDLLNDPAILAFIQSQVQQGIQQALKGRPPKASTANPTATQRAAFDAMLYKERLQLFQSDPASYYKLVEGGN